MTDIPQLIARLTTLRAGLGLFHDADQEAITEAITTLDAQAQEIEQSERVIAGLNSQLTAEIAATQALAREIERLKEWGKKFHEVGSANAQRAEAAEAEVKRLKQLSLGSIYKEATDRLEAAQARVKELESLLELYRLAKEPTA